MALSEDFLPPMLKADKPAAVSHSLQNSDFRRLLETPRVHGEGAAANPKGLGSSKPSKPYDKKKGKPPRPKKKGEEGADEKDKDKGPTYRDRAEERRKGTNLDYERVEQDVASILQGNAMLLGDIGRISVEESKYLGGDVEHTHLVKGLDYSLLQKVRNEVQQDTKASKQAEVAAPQPRKEDLKFVTHLGRNIYNALFAPPATRVSELFLPGRTSFVYEAPEEAGGADVLTTLRRSKADCPPEQELLTADVNPDVLERLGKLMAYLQPTAAGKGGKKQRKKDRQRALEGLQTLGPFGGGERAAEREALTPRSQPAQAEGLPPRGLAARRESEEEENIFDDAPPAYQPDAPLPSSASRRPENESYFAEPGEVPPPPPGTVALPPPPPPPGPEAGPSRPPPGYDPSQAYRQPGPVPLGQVDPATVEAYVQSQVAFQASADPEYQALLARQAGGLQEGAGGPLGDLEEGEGGLTQQQKEAGLASVFKRDDNNLALRREDDKREQEPGFVSDAYAECYPAYHDFGTQVVDSDEEADFSQMDSQRGKSRVDFETEEQWQSYKSSKESLPKAAFQFGVKAGDGRKKGRNLDRKQDNKLSSELNKIQQHLEKDGKDYSKAFAAPEKAAGKKQRDASKAAEATPYSKKRRI